MTLEIETPKALSEILEIIRESPIPFFYSVAVFMLMIIDYGVGAIPGPGDIIDFLNICSAMVLQGDEGDLDLTNAILLIEFIPGGDLLPTELWVFMKIMLKHNRPLAIIMLIVGIVLVIVLLFVLISVVGIAGLWFGGYLLI